MENFMEPTESSHAVMLQPGGTLQQTLERSGRQLLNEGVRLLHKRVTETARSICRRFAEFESQDASQESRSRYTYAVLGDYYSKDIEEPVLRYCVACLGHLEAATDLEEKAWRAYRKSPEDYQAILIDLLPEDFRRRADAYFAQQAYQEGTNATAAEDWPVFVDWLQTERGAGPLGYGLPTGLAKLDNALGGLHGLTVIGGDRGVGKTSLLLHMAMASLKRVPELACLLLSLDMSKKTMYERLLCHEADVDYQFLKNATWTEEVTKRLIEASHRLRREILPRLRIVERRPEHRTQGLTHGELIVICGQLVRATQAGNLLIGIDLFQRMDVPQAIANELDKDDYRLDVIQQLRQESRNEYRPDGFPILVTSEIRKMDGTRHELTQDDLRGSGRLLSDADVVMLLSPGKNHRNGAPTVPVTLRISKGRDGVMRGDLPVNFQYNRCQFTDGEPAAPVSRRQGEETPPRNDVGIDPLARGR
jgi:replicative DNA helicase